MKFLRNLSATILGCLIAFGILVAMFVFFAVLVRSQDDSMTVTKNSVLELNFSQPIKDYVGRDDNDPFNAFFGSGVGLDDILHTIKVAATDENIEGISLTAGFLRAGLAQVQEIRKALLDFKSSGKFIYAHSDFFAQKDYYLASVADRIYLNPVGTMEFKGLATEVLYYRDLQEKSGVKMEVVRHGKYKSAVEPFLSNTMSEDNRAQIRALITSMWDTMVHDISRSRNMHRENLNAIADTLGARTPDHAIASGLLDDKLHYDEYESLLKDELGLTVDEAINYVDFYDYVRKARRKKIQKGKDKVAVIYAQGEILYGEGGKNFIGQGSITEAFQSATEDDGVKAIVLRVDSPGGSALVSDIIWRHVELAKKKKPVVVSFGNIAASGGYYIGVAGNKIFAEPTTITGSIGVFGTIPNISSLAAEVGINAEQVGTNKNSVGYSFFEPMGDSFRSILEEGVEDTYQTFIGRVASGRNMAPEAVDAVAQGRVWSGTDAKRIGLVDELGSLDDAIAAAAKLADMDHYGIRKYPKYKSGFEQFMEDFGSAKSKITSVLVEKEIGEEAYRALRELKQLAQQEGIQARMPFSLNIK